MNKPKFFTVIALNSLIVIGEIIFGNLANSTALIADALHNLGDVLTLIIALIAFIFSEKKASRAMTYGYIRSEMMAGFVHSIFLLFTMGFIIWEAATKILNPSPVGSIYMIIAALTAFFANAASAYLLRGAKHQHKDHTHEERHEDMNIAASYLHLLSDAGFSIGVVIAGVLILFLNIPIIDPIITILFSLFIIYQSLGIFKKTFFSLMDAAPNNLKGIVRRILKHKEIKSIHDIHIIQPSSQDLLFSAHLVLDSRVSLGKIEILFEALRCELAEFGVTHTLFQPETEKYHNADTLCQSHS